MEGKMAPIFSTKEFLNQIKSKIRAWPILSPIWSQLVVLEGRGLPFLNRDLGKRRDSCYTV